MAESNNIVMVFTYLDQSMIDMVYSLLLWNRYFPRPEILLFREGTVPTHPVLQGSLQHKGIAYKRLGCACCSAYQDRGKQTRNRDLRRTLQGHVA